MPAHPFLVQSHLHESLDVDGTAVVREMTSLHGKSLGHSHPWAIQSEDQMEVRLGGMFTYDGPGTLTVLQAFVEETRLTTFMMIRVITGGGLGQAVSVPHLSLDSRTPVRAVISLRLTPVRGTRGEALNSRILVRDNYNQDYPCEVSLPYIGQR